MAKKTYKITRWDGGRNTKYDARDIAEEEVVDAVNVGITNPGYFTPSGNFKNYWNASDNEVQTYTVADFTSASSKDNTQLFAFAHDYEIGFKVNVDSGSTALDAIGVEATEFTTKATGTTLTDLLAGGDGSMTGNVYMKNVTQSSLTAVNAGTPFAEDQKLYVGGADKGDVTATGATGPETTTSPMLCFGDGNTCDIYDDGESVWLKQVMTLSNGETWDASGTSSNATNVYHRFFFTDGALRMNDANFSNTNNYPGWFGHIKREFLQNILEYDGTAKTRDVVKYNSWFDDVMAPAPPNDTNAKGLVVMDSYTESYPSYGEKVVLRMRQSSAAIPITQIAVSAADTGLMVATTVAHAAIGLVEGDEVTITGVSGGGTFIVNSVTSPTTFTFYGNFTTAESSLDGSEIVQDGDDTNPADTNWIAILASDGSGTDGWTNADPSVFTDGGGTASLINILASPYIQEGQTYTLTFTVGTASLDMIIGGGDADGHLSTNLASEFFLSETTYTAGTHTVVFTANGTHTHLWFTAFDTSAGSGTLDDVSLKKAGATVLQAADAINPNLKEKWIFGMSFLYDGIGEQESPIKVGQKTSDGSTFYQMDLDTASTHVVDMRNFVNRPEMDITFIYDDVKESTSKWWHPRKTGFKIYMKRVEATESGEWLLFSHVDLVKGEYIINAGDAQILPLHQGETNPEYEVNLRGGPSTTLTQFNNVPLESYFTETLGVPEHLSNFRASWKAQALINRINWIGNVLVNGETFPDRLMKSPVLRYDIFPNDESFVVDVIPSDGDEIIHLEPFGDRLLVFKRYSLIIVNVSGSLETIESINKGMGVINTRMVCATDTGIAWINTHGLMHYDGETIKNLISEKFQTVGDWSVGVNNQIAFDSQSRHLIVLVAPVPAAAYGWVYDFFTESFFYHNFI